MPGPPAPRGGAEPGGPGRAELLGQVMAALSDGGSYAERVADGDTARRQLIELAARQAGYLLGVATRVEAEVVPGAGTRVTVRGVRR